MAANALASPGLRPSPPKQDAAVSDRTVAAELWARRLQLLRPLPVLLLAAGLLAASPAPPESVVGQPDVIKAASKLFALRGLSAEPTEIFSVDPPPGTLKSRLFCTRLLARARRPGEPADIYLLKARVSPEGRILGGDSVYNLTDTSAVDERGLVVNGEHATWVIGAGRRTYSVHLADLGGEPLPHGDDWTALQRWQYRLTSLQETGQLAGVYKRSFKLKPPPQRLVAGLSDDALVLDADAHKIRVPLSGSGPIEGEQYVGMREHHPARPGNLVTWAVDRVRGLPWFGQERMQWLKAVVFDALDRYERAMGSIAPTDSAEYIADELGDLIEAAPVTYTDPTTGWPPPPLEPILPKPVKGEGQWVSLENDPFTRNNPGAPSPFVFSFIRIDRERPYLQVSITLWDPRQIELHAVSGTQEPKSATGETGEGIVPRDPEVMSRFVAAFNGGFQAMHGEFGMLAEKVLYLPPKPYAATVAVLDDSSTAFGTWPTSPEVPSNLISFRQNLTPLVQDGKPNPYKRHWWGGVPVGWEHESRTVRSALCLTREHFIAYLYGAGIDASQLIQAAMTAHCSYAVHLDMNAGHTGLEFYRAGPAGTLPAIARPLDPMWEARGEVPDMNGWEYLGRRMIKYMGLMNFPRYIDRESRDFFYLTLRHILPGSPLPPRLKASSGQAAAWSVTNLPQYGWPYAIAQATVAPEPARPDTLVHLLKLDARMLAPGGPGDAEQTVVMLPLADAKAPRSCWFTPSGFVIAENRPAPSAVRIAGGFRADEPESHGARAAVAVDEGSMLLYAEIAAAPVPGQDRLLLARLLSGVGGRQILLLREPLGVAIGGKRDLAGQPVAMLPGLRLVRSDAPGARRIFEDTPVVSPGVWAPLQRKRVELNKGPAH